MEITAIVLAFASLVISLAALYATALKEATIGLHHTALDQAWHVGGWSGLTPAGDAHVTVAVYAHNSGANAGILEKIEAKAPETLGGLFGQPIAWYPAKTAPELQPANASARFPRGIDAGEIEELYLVGRVHVSLGPIQRLRADREDDIRREEAFARQLFEAKGLPVTIEWRYARPAGWFGGKQPTTQTGTLAMEVAIDGLRDYAVRAWQNQAAQVPDWQRRVDRLVAIASTGQPPA